MKKLLFIISVACVVFMSCRSDESKAKKLIKQSLRQSLQNPKSYKAIEFGTLDSAFSTIEEYPLYNASYSRLLLFSKKGEEVLTEIENYKNPLSQDDKQKRNALLEDSKRYVDSIKYYQRMHEKMVNDFRPAFKGWKMTHRFKADNLRGHEVASNFIYYFDKKVTRIVSSEDIGENSKAEDD